MGQKKADLLRKKNQLSQKGKNNAKIQQKI
jgi:hypothetical protein